MILYANGDEHTAAALALNEFAFAHDDIRCVAQGRRPHPENLAASWCMHLSRMMGLGLKCDAESDSSNARILRTTNQFLDARPGSNGPFTVMVIGWSTWDRDEILDVRDGQWYQVCAEGNDEIPDHLSVPYRKYLSQLDYRTREKQSHEAIHQLHMRLMESNMPHLFFNSTWHFSSMQEQLDWHGCYVEPYDADWSFSEWAKSKKFEDRGSGQFGPDAHRAWAELLSLRLTPLLDNV